MHKCECLISTRLTVDTVINIYAVAELNNADSLCFQCVNFIRDHWLLVKRSEAVTSSPEKLEVIVGILSHQ